MPGFGIGGLHRKIAQELIAEPRNMRGSESRPVSRRTRGGKPFCEARL